jgi:hypothetical protein
MQVLKIHLNLPKFDRVQNFKLDRFPPNLSRNRQNSIQYKKLDSPESGF